MKPGDHSGLGAADRGAQGGGSAGGGLTPKQREKRRRRQRALELHGEGKTLQEIADELGWSSPSGVAYALKTARRELREVGPLDDREDLRQLTYERYEMLLSRYLPLAPGGISDGERIPPSIKHARVVLRILADEIELLGLNVDPEEVIERASQAMAVPEASHDGQPLIVVDFDRDRYEEAKRLARSPRDEVVAVDDQPPAGRIAPRPVGDSAEYDGAGLEPNSVDPSTGQPIFDPGVALRRD